MYKVIEYFTDLHDKEYPYNVGDVFPREGIKVAEERFAELAGSSNRRGIPLIALVKEPEVVKEPKAVAKPRKAPAKKAKKTAEE